jgi:hypothetical protein
LSENAFLPTVNHVLKGLGLQADVTADYDHSLTLIAENLSTLARAERDELLALSNLRPKIPLA